MKSKLFQTLTILAVLLLAIPSTLVMAAAYPQPTYVKEPGPSTVPPYVYAPVIDGDASEWTAADFFTDLSKSGKGVDFEAKMYARYDCRPQPPDGFGILYVYVDALDGFDILVSAGPDEHYVKINGVKKVDGNNAGGTQPAFAYVGLAGGTAAGWEASFLIGQGTYALDVHTQVLDPAGAPQTAATTSSTQLVLNCTPPAAVEMASFTAEVAGPAIDVSWETVSEVDSLGFNLYRATGVAGTRARLNAALVPTQVPGSPVGAVYSFLDTTAERGVTYYYWLEAVDADGASSFHGPAVATLKAYVKVLPGRPRPVPAPVVKLP